jgi:hypothetical protein
LVEVSDNRIRALAHTILARPEYANVHPSAPATWLRSLLQRFLEWLGSFDSLHATAPALYWLIWAALMGVFAILVTHIVWTISTALRAPLPPEPLPASPDLRDPAADAERLAAAGSYLEAAHTLMIASFRTMAEQSIIELRPDRPNRWIRRALLSSSLNEPLARDIDSLIQRTERHWFGDRENDPAIYTRWRSAYEMLAQVPR